MTMTGMLNFLHKRELGSRHREEKTFTRKKMLHDRSLYRKDLKSHFGCVNSVEWSSCGSLLASGGDDRRVLVWQTDRILSDDTDYQPGKLEAEHNSNIFCLGFDSGNTRIYSGGNDEQVIVHDLHTLQPLDFFPHEEPVYGLSVHPVDPHLVLTACSDGRLLLLDTRARASEEPLMLAGFSHAFHSVAFNPVEPRLVISANQKHGVGLWDMRKPRRCVLEYGNIGGRQQSSMYVRWNQAGDRIVGLRRRKPPVMYRLDRPEAMCQFYDPCYYNSCTMKSCCFGGPDDQFVFSGSDDFNLYMWQVPGEGDTTTLVNRAHMVLEDHRSIVNQVRYNHDRALIASSGVEKMVKLWSVLPLPDRKSWEQSKEEVGGTSDRRVYSHDEYIGLVLRAGSVSQDYRNESVEENPNMMAFFDSLVQREIEGWDSSESGDTETEPEVSDTVVETEEELESARYTRRERLVSRTDDLLGQRMTIRADAALASDSDPGTEAVLSPDSSLNSSSVTQRSSTLTGSSSSSFTQSSGSPLMDSSIGLDHSPDSSMVPSIRETVVGPSPQPLLNPSAETQTSPQTSQNRIAELIARKRARLINRARRRCDREPVNSSVQVSWSLARAGRVLRSGSSSSQASPLSQREEEEDSNLGQWGEGEDSPRGQNERENSPLRQSDEGEDGPRNQREEVEDNPLSMGEEQLQGDDLRTEPDLHVDCDRNAVLARLRRKRLRLLNNISDDSEDDANGVDDYLVPEDVTSNAESVEPPALLLKPPSCCSGTEGGQACSALTDVVNDVGGVLDEKSDKELEVDDSEMDNNGKAVMGESSMSGLSVFKKSSKSKGKKNFRQRSQEDD